MAEEAAKRRRRTRGERIEVDPMPHHGCEHIGDGLAANQPPSREHLPQHHPECPDVRARVDRFAASLLGAHVGGGAEDDALDRGVTGDGGGEGQARVAGLRLPCLGEAEVEHLDGAVGPDPDVGGLEVAVDDAGLVGGLEGLGDLTRDGYGLVDRDRPAGDHLVKPLALHQLHDEEVDCVEL